MFAAQTHRTALVTTKLAAKTILTGIFFVFAFSHSYLGRRFPQIIVLSFNFVILTTYIQRWNRD